LASGGGGGFGPPRFTPGLVPNWGIPSPDPLLPFPMEKFPIYVTDTYYADYSKPIHLTHHVWSMQTKSILNSSHTTATFLSEKSSSFFPLLSLTSIPQGPSPLKSRREDHASAKSSLPCLRRARRRTVFFMAIRKYMRGIFGPLRRTTFYADGKTSRLRYS